MNARKSLFLLIFIATVIWGSLPSSADDANKAASSPTESRYLLLIAGCNDCHTRGFLISGGKIAETDWLTGDITGWSGPWGTTYAPNLRLILQNMTEDSWIGFAHNLTARPPMPWWTLRIMRDSDLRSLYRFVRNLGPKGQNAPAYLPPGQKPEPPYALFVMPCPPGEACNKETGP